MVPVGAYTPSAEAAVNRFEFDTAMEIDLNFNVI